MAENDDVVYVAGSDRAPNQAGTNVWRSSGGGAFELVFNQTDKGLWKVALADTPPERRRPRHRLLGRRLSHLCGESAKFRAGWGRRQFLPASDEGWRGELALALQRAGRKRTPDPARHGAAPGSRTLDPQGGVQPVTAPLFGFACGCDNSNLVTEDGGQSGASSPIRGAGGGSAPHQSCYDVCSTRPMRAR